MAGPFPTRVTGPFAGQVDGFRAELRRLGYSRRSAEGHLYVLAHLSRWLEEEELPADRLTTDVLGRFVACSREAGRRRPRSVRSLRLLVDYLCASGVVPPAPLAPTSSLERLLENYRRYLSVERRLAATTVRSRGDLARRFLDGLDPGRLAPSEVTAFVLRESRRYGTGSMKGLTAGLRSLLRFLYLDGALDRELTGAVPTVASWRKTALPRGVDRPTVQALLDSCDRATVLGARDFAILTLLSRLGLRAGEVAAIELGDIDWRAGEIVVRGKGNRRDRLPLPNDVGEAIVAYLSVARPTPTCRAVFRRGHAPEGPMTPHTVVMVPRRAAQRIGAPAVGAHRLRHAAATDMLAGGASLSEIAQVLRHGSESTTQIYAAVDRAALSRVVRPWPGAGR